MLWYWRHNILTFQSGIKSILKTALIDEVRKAIRWNKAPTFMAICLFVYLQVYIAEAQIFKPMIVSSEDFSLESRFQHYESYDIATDSNGYCYFAGDEGIHRFNGRQMIRLTERAGYENTSYVDLFKDSSGALWVSSYRQGLMRIVGDSIIPYKHNNLIKQFSFRDVESIHVDAEHNVHIAGRNRGYHIISSEGLHDIIYGRSRAIHGFVVMHKPDGDLFYFSVLSDERFHRGDILNIYYLHKDGVLDSIGTVPDRRPNFQSGIVKQDGLGWLLSIGSETLIEGYKDSIIRMTLFPHKIINLFRDSRSNLWIGTVEGGIYRIPANPSDDTLHLLPGQTAAVTTEGANGELWIKSNRRYFYCLPDQDLLIHSFVSETEDPLKIRLFTLSDTKLYCLLESGKIAILNNDTVKNINIPLGSKYSGMLETDRLPLSIHFNKYTKRLYAGYWSMLAWWNDANWSTIPIKTPRDVPHKLSSLITHDSTLFMPAPTSGVFRMEGKSAYLMEDLGIEKFIRIYQMQIDDQGVIWIATTRGLWVYENDSLQRPVTGPEGNELNELTITEVAELGGDIWLRSLKRGLLRISGNEIEKVEDQDGETIYGKNYFVSDHGKLWMHTSGSGQNVISVNLENNEPVVNRYYLNDFITDYGALDNALAIHNDVFYFGTLGGIFKKQISQLKAHGPVPKVLIKQVFSNHLELSISKKQELSHHHTNLNILLDLISFRMQGSKVECRLLGLDSNWTLLKHNAIQYTNLNPGNYSFQVRARIKDEPWSEISEMHFNILTPFWQTWWFKGLEILLVLALTFFASLTWFRIRHKRAILELGKSSAEQRALRAQMNPHFIFNVLSSIQDMIFHNDRFYAVKYVALFANLMRNILKHSGRELISLAEEVQTLRDYLKLEAMRFDSKFSFEVNIASEIDSEKVQLPPLLLQPLVENAIKHGLVKMKSGDGFIEVQFYQHNSALYCKVQDNGIGRKKAAELQEGRRVEHRSFGLVSIRQRIELLNARRKQKITFDISDRFDIKGQPNGTHVMLIIPLNTANK